MSTSDSVEARVMRLLLKRAKKVPDHSSVGKSFPSIERSTVFPPYEHVDWQSFAIDYMLISLLKKSKLGTNQKLAREAACRAWYGSEAECFKTNIRLDHIAPEMLPFIWKVQQKISSVIGSSPDFEKLDCLHKWGPGATFDIKRSEASAATKHTRVISVTKRCLPHLLRVVDPHWAEAMGMNGFKVVRGNRCVTVPKSSETDRMISVEPTGNSFLQSAVGRYFRSCLMKRGVDLNDQTINQRRAQAAYFDCLATIDLSSASDTMSRALVDLLLPPKWVRYLNELRSPYSYLNGKWVRLEKFSSMGNGFTFELESLIFWAIASSVQSEQVVTVFGDDIICEARGSQAVINSLTYFGFSINLEKSYTSGPFYESCGKHYLRGIDVTPVYQKSSVVDLFEMIRFHNRLFRWARRTDVMWLVKDSLILIRNLSKERYGRGKSKEIPIVPQYCHGDLGFLCPDIPVSETKRYLTFDKSPIIRSASSIEELGFFAWKLRSPTLHANAFPDGRCGVVRGTRFVFRRRTFWYSSMNCY